MKGKEEEKIINYQTECSIDIAKDDFNKVVFSVLTDSVEVVVKGSKTLRSRGHAVRAFSSHVIPQRLRAKPTLSSKFLTLNSPPLARTYSPCVFIPIGISRRQVQKPNFSLIFLLTKQAQ
jgi:hypothetical protein